MTRSQQAQRLFQQFNLCAYCEDELVLEYGHKKSLTQDHVVPKSKGGRTKVVTCYDCNSRKGAKTLFNFLSELHNDDKTKVESIFNRIAQRVTGSERVQLGHPSLVKGLYICKGNHSEQRRHRRNQASSDNPQLSVQFHLPWG